MKIENQYLKYSQAKLPTKIDRPQAHGYINIVNQRLDEDYLDY